VDLHDVYQRFREPYRSQHADDIFQTTRRYITENIVLYSHTKKAGCCYSSSADFYGLSNLNFIPTLGTVGWFAGVSENRDNFCMRTEVQDQEELQ
jgi:hypothetical protein